MTRGKGTRRKRPPTPEGCLRLWQRFLWHGRRQGPPQTEGTQAPADLGRRDPGGGHFTHWPHAFCVAALVREPAAIGRTAGNCG